jgi:tetratricopeptide (TPR) repeat protein
LYRRTSALFPELPEGWMGLCRLALLQKNFDAAHKISSQNQSRYGDFVSSYQMGAEVEFFSRNFSEAEKLYQELATKDPNGGTSFYGAVSYQSALGRLGLEGHDQNNSRRILEAALKNELDRLQSLPQDPRILYCAAAIESSLDETEPALAHLRKAAEAGWIDYRSMALDPRFDGISGDPRFGSIIRGMQTKMQRARQHLSQHHSEK